MTHMFQVLILGASYGSLLATKLVMAGHDMTLGCLPQEADLINREGTTVRFPIRGQQPGLHLAQLRGQPTVRRPIDTGLATAATSAPKPRKLQSHLAEQPGNPVRLPIFHVGTPGLTINPHPNQTQHPFHP
jgi:hypothetical protein